jgi:hypothetical protein
VDNALINNGKNKRGAQAGCGRGNGNGAGRPRKIRDEIHLAKEFIAYAKEVDDSPLLEPVLFQYEGKVVTGHKRKQRPYSIGGLLRHIGVTKHAWRKWTQRDDLREMMAMIEDCIWVQRFEGAAAGLFKAKLFYNQANKQRIYKVKREDHSG